MPRGHLGNCSTLCCFGLAFAQTAWPQDHEHASQGTTQAHGHAAQDEPAPHDMHELMRAFYGAYPPTRESSGTAWQPEATPMSGTHGMLAGWSWMTHGFAFLGWDDQSGARGGEQIFSTNMFMAMATRRLGEGTLGLRGMLSLEPATVGDDGYPLLFQTGETADGQTALVDAQHPHDLFMELAASYSLPLAEGRSVFAYFGLPGEPALGPPAFMHRSSAEQNPLAPLGHHWLDSTHISYGVATLGWIEGDWKLDASFFNGAEPDQHRWDIEEPRFDSESARLTWNPDAAWSLQASFGSLESPEQLEPGVDVDRLTASAMWSLVLDRWVGQTTLAFGENRKHPGPRTDALLFESAWTLDERDTWFARIERVEKDELFAAGDPLAGQIFPVGEFSLGYSHEFARVGSTHLALGAVASVFAIEQALENAYGDTPASLVLFLRAGW